MQIGYFATTELEHDWSRITKTDTIINICWFNNKIFQYFGRYIFLLDMKQTDFPHIFYV